MKINTTSGDFDFTYLSLGAGWQSTALLVLACTDPRVPKPDVAIFADTGDEPPWVYEAVGRLTVWAASYGVPVHVASHKSGESLSDWVVGRRKRGKRFVSVPIYTASPNGGREGMLRRQCTREFKLEPIHQEVRTVLGYKPRQRVKERVRALLGISRDEAIRMKPSRLKWITNSFPLIDLDIRRTDCREIVTSVGLPPPQKSACVYCPYHSDTYWSWMKHEHPDVFSGAVAFDHAIRDMTMAGREQPGYVHRSCQPLDQVDFSAPDPTQESLFDDSEDMMAECEGMCGL